MAGHEENRNLIGLIIWITAAIVVIYIKHPLPGSYHSWWKPDLFKSAISPLNSGFCFTGVVMIYNEVAHATDLIRTRD